MAGDKRKVQEINAGSMADIAFLLLIFFLVATTMNTDTGLTRVLPPMPDPNQKQEDVKVKERNLLLVFVSKGNNIMAGGQQMDIHQLKDKAKEFILNPMEDENLPEKEVKEFELPDGSKWNYPVSLGVISLQTDQLRNLHHGAERVDTRLQRGAQRGGHAQVRSEIRRSERRSAKYINQGGSAEDLGGRAA